MGVTGRQGPRSDSSPVPAAAGAAAYQRSHAPWFHHTILRSLREAHTVSCAYSWLPLHPPQGPAVYFAVLPDLQAPLPHFARKEITGSPAPPRKGRGQKPPCQCGKPQKQAQKFQESSTGVWRRNRISPPLMLRTSVRVHHQKARGPLIHRASISPFGDAFNPGALGQHRIQDKAV